MLQPPKQKYTNYKELQEVRKKEKVEKADINKRKVSFLVLVSATVAFDAAFLSSGRASGL